MDEDVIPRLVFGWTGPSDLIVPLVRPLKGFVHSHDHPSVVKLPMMNRLPDGEGAHDAFPLVFHLCFQLLRLGHHHGTRIITN